MSHGRHKLEALLESQDGDDWDPEEMEALIDAHLDWLLDRILVSERPFYRERMRRREAGPVSAPVPGEGGGLWRAPGSSLPRMAVREVVSDYPMATLG